MKTINWIQLFLLVLLIGFGLGYAQFEKMKLANCSNEYQAVVISKYKNRKSGRVFRYKYSIGGVKYDSSQSFNSEWQWNEVFIGDTITLDVSCTHPNISKPKIKKTTFYH